MPSPTAVILYHFLHPDDVVSAQIWTELAAGLQSRGWTVSAFPSNRSCHQEAVAFPQTEECKGVVIQRVWRPGFSQASRIGRIVNAVWMIGAWSFRAAASNSKPDVVLIGTDPILSVLIAPIWRLFSPRTRVAHWCFDLYPEAAVADGLFKPGSLLPRILSALARRAYRSCDLIADLGPCMRQRLESYRHRAQTITLTPWALEEPGAPVLKDRPERQTLFGPTATLGLLYSGSFGRAHVFEPFLALARAARHLPMQMAFSVRGNREASLRAAIREDDANIRIVGFASPDGLETRLAAADIHLVSLHEDWTGTVVPSKFFGALAVGRPVLYAGNPNSAVAQFIERHQVGWVLSGGDVSRVIAQLRELIDDPARLEDLSARCLRVYAANFSKSKMCDAWDYHLRRLIGGSPTQSSSHPPSRSVF